MAIPNELLPRCEDGQQLQDALTCLKASHPGTFPNPGNYDHIHIRMLMRKMLPRDYDNRTCVRGVRVFWRPGANNLDIAVFLFVRVRPKNPRAYFMSVGAGTSVPAQTIVNDLNEIANYMRTQPGGQPLILLGKMTTPQTEEPPVTASPNLDAAFQIARHGIPGNPAHPQLLFYQGLTAADSPPWPDQMHWWTIQPH